MIRRLIAATAIVLSVGATAGVPANAASAQTSSGAGSAVRIVKIHYRQSGTNLNTEYIVFKNVSGSKINLRGWKIISSPRTDHQVYRFPTTRIKAGNTLVLYTGHGTNSGGKRYWNSSSPVWNNDGDYAVLRNRAGHTIDTCKYAGGGTTAYC